MVPAQSSVVGTANANFFAAMLFAAELLELIPVAHVREEFHWVTCPG
jgi:hypothetical protein